MEVMQRTLNHVVGHWHMWTQTYTLSCRVSSCWFKIIWTRCGCSLCLQSWWCNIFLHWNGRFRNKITAQWVWKWIELETLQSVALGVNHSLKHVVFLLLNVFLHMLFYSLKYININKNIYPISFSFWHYKFTFILFYIFARMKV